MIRLCNGDEIKQIGAIINDAAQAYKGVIPVDRFHEPYMSEKELAKEIQDGVIFWGYEDQEKLVGVMGVQDKGDVALIRHAYVRTNQRNKGLGGLLLSHIVSLIEKPLLIGTWESASWAISFYKKYGFDLVSNEEKELLLTKYWDIPKRQVDTSVVLCDQKWNKS
jgi:N-acetylglutamate synthase-like GNAT family acetyltransferase